MRRIWMLTYGLSLLIGFALWLAAPTRWGLEPGQALLIGSGLYFGALHRFVRRAVPEGAEGTEVGWARLVPGLAVRAAIFIGLAALQAYLCFEVLSQADVRSGFVLSASWLMAWAVLDNPRKEAS